MNLLPVYQRLTILCNRIVKISITVDRKTLKYPSLSSLLFSLLLTFNHALMNGNYPENAVSITGVTTFKTYSMKPTFIRIILVFWCISHFIQRHILSPFVTKWDAHGNIHIRICRRKCPVYADEDVLLQAPFVLKNPCRWKVGVFVLKTGYPWFISFMNLTHFMRIRHAIFSLWD